jgi:chromosome segregation ATPase
MWKNIWSFIELVSNASHRINRLEKDVERLEKENREANREIQLLWHQLGRLAERENFRDEALRREFDLQRAKAETQQAKAEIARLKPNSNAAPCRPLPLKLKTTNPENRSRHPQLACWLNQS